MDLQARLSNPLDIAETPAAQGSGPIVGLGENLETTQSGCSEDPSEGPREEEGRLSNPPQRRLSPTDINDLVDAYRAGATISQLAVDFGVHRTTVASHLDRHGVPRHSEQTTWYDEILTHAAELDATGLSLADVADQFGVDAQTVANRLRRARVAIRPDGAGNHSGGHERNSCRLG